MPKEKDDFDEFCDAVSEDLASEDHELWGDCKDKLEDAEEKADRLAEAARKRMEGGYNPTENVEEKAERLAEVARRGMGGRDSPAEDVKKDDELENVENGLHSRRSLTEEEEEKQKEINRRLEESTLSEQEKEDRGKDAQRLKKLGNELYLLGNNGEAVKRYQEALDICPLSFEEDRGILFANLGAAHMKMGQNDTAIEDCSKAVKLKPHYVKALLRRANLYEQCDKPHEAFEDFKKILEIDPRHGESLSAMQRLPNKIKERDEALKAEMIDNLKKIGNMVLNPFGLSTDNFKFVQDPKTGGYTINFTQEGC